jgi:hypothetical protein
MTVFKKKAVSLCLLLTLCATGMPTSAEDLKSEAGAANYFPAICQELTRLQIQARCDEASVCTFEHRLSPDGPVLKAFVRYSRLTDTVYAYLDNMIVFEHDEIPSMELLVTLLSFNAKMVTSKFEWHAHSRSVRLSTVLSCDSNFDRRAFRSQIKGLLTVAKELYPKISD